jgi:NAD(P)-dependent dehydrogenase (short-subunit alcohol dehydrogenase family)
MSQSPFRKDLLKGHLALVTGSSSGIGAAAARALSHAGASVIVCGRNGERVHAIANELDSASTLVVDLAQPRAAAQLANKAEEIGPIDILVNSAGLGITKRTARLSEADIDSMLAVNVRAGIVLSAQLGEAMQKRGRGSIINMSSIVAALGTPFQTGYAATKGAVEASTRALARELGPQGVRVNAIAPGLIATEMWGDRLDDEDFKNQSAERVTLRRWGTGEDIANAVVFLASDASAYITGDGLTVDGGLVRTGDLVPSHFFGRRP